MTSAWKKPLSPFFSRWKKNRYNAMNNSNQAIIVSKREEIKDYLFNNSNSIHVKFRNFFSHFQANERTNWYIVFHVLSCFATVASFNIIFTRCFAITQVTYPIDFFPFGSTVRLFFSAMVRYWTATSNSVLSLLSSIRL